MLFGAIPVSVGFDITLIERMKLIVHGIYALTIRVGFGWRY
jgi:hypothetical protein